MRMLRIPGLVAIVLAMTTAAVLAHQVTYKGTVMALDKESVRVTVVDEKTKKAAAMKFDFDKETKILRGDKRVTIAEAQIVKGEKIAVTIDHDVDETLAIVIRLDEKK
jgi:hypothetical protein